jgi:hypothetical protein
LFAALVLVEHPIAFDLAPTMTSDTKHTAVLAASRDTSNKDRLHNDDNTTEDGSSIDADERLLVRRDGEPNAAA